LRTIYNVDSVSARQIGVAFEAMLLAPMLQPIVQGADAIGEYGIDLLARSIAGGDAHGFAALVAVRFEALP
jgi:hypothetical protein